MFRAFIYFFHHLQRISTWQVKWAQSGTLYYLHKRLQETVCLSISIFSNIYILNSDNKLGVLFQPDVVTPRCVSVCVYGCVCIYVWERERERAREWAYSTCQWRLIIADSCYEISLVSSFVGDCSAGTVSTSLILHTDTHIQIYKGKEKIWRDNNPASNKPKTVEL